MTNDRKRDENRDVQAMSVSIRARVRAEAPAASAPLLFADVD